IRGDGAASERADGAGPSDGRADRAGGERSEEDEGVITPAPPQRGELKFDVQLFHFVRLGLCRRDPFPLGWKRAKPFLLIYNKKNSNRRRDRTFVAQLRAVFPKCKNQEHLR